MHTLQGEKYLWKLPHFNHESVLDLASTYNLSFPIIQTLLSRGYADKDAIRAFLFSSFEADVAHPSLLKDAVKGVERILQAIQKKEKILVVGDYDVDGVTSCAMMMISLLPLDADINFFTSGGVLWSQVLTGKVILTSPKGKSLIVTVENTGQISLQ